MQYPVTPKNYNPGKYQQPKVAAGSQYGKPKKAPEPTVGASSNRGKVKRNMADRSPKVAAGDNYGLGFKAPVGQIRGTTVGYVPVSLRKLKEPPTSVV